MRVRLLLFGAALLALTAAACSENPGPMAWDGKTPRNSLVESDSAARGGGWGGSGHMTAGADSTTVVQDGGGWGGSGH